jgi:hypothetical protein
LDSLPPHVLAADSYAYAAGDIYPRGARERELCARASHPDWAYLGALAALDVIAFGFGSSEGHKYASSVLVRLTGPAMIGVAWGATIGGAWLALPKCSPEWIGDPPREGDIRETWPVALSLALLAGATAPIVNGIAIGSNLPVEWTDFERAMHVVVAGIAGFGGALLPYVIPPRTVRAGRELERIRLGVDPRGGMFLGYSARF